MADLPFVRAGTKKSLIALFRRGEFTPRMWARLIESIVTKDELETFAASGSIDADDVSTDTTDFDGILGSGNTTVQSALDTLDDIDYDDISGNDAATDVTGAELEELSDGSDTTLHGHDVTGLTNWNGEYLPLTAGNSYRITGNVYTKNNWVLYSRNAADNGEIQALYVNSLNDVVLGGVSYDTILAGTSVDCNYTDFTVTNNPLGVTHALKEDGNANLCQQGGYLTSGDATNYTRIGPLGIYLEGTATQWDDLRIAINSTKLGGSKDPGFAVFKTDGGAPASQGVFLYWFDKSNEEELYFVAQMPHAWDEGTDIECHVHWVPASTSASAGLDVCWGLEYTWANINGTFGNTTLIYGDEQTNGATETITVDKHYLTELGTIDATGKTMSSMLVCRVFRDATGAGGTDDYDDDAGLLEIDFHYQINSLGSKEEYVKGP